MKKDNIIKYPSFDSLEELLMRPELPDVESKVTEVINKVKLEGDSALKDFALKFDKVKLDNLRVSEEEISAAEANVSSELKAAIKLAIDNIHKFYNLFKPEGKIGIETTPGVKCWKVMRPIENVGVYVPSGLSPLFSSLYMSAIPARIAGVKNITVCVPPLSDGSIHSSILYVAKQFNIKDIFKVGGAGAIAAMAYGTKTIPKVDKIVGPGSPFTVTAKQILASRQIDIDIVAGASEVLIIADKSANPKFIAADMLAQAEHGPSSQAILVTTCEDLASKTSVEIKKQLELLPRQFEAESSISSSKIIVVKTIDEAIEINDTYAPEHLIIQTEDSMSVADKINNAGSVFVGHYSAEVLGDYGSGTNHILPTGGWARRQGGVAVNTFLKGITFQEVTKAGFDSIAPSLAKLAREESLEAHARALDVRSES